MNLTHSIAHELLVADQPQVERSHSGISTIPIRNDSPHGNHRRPLPLSGPEYMADLGSSPLHVQPQTGLYPPTSPPPFPGVLPLPPPPPPPPHGLSIQVQRSDVVEEDPKLWDELEDDQDALRDSRDLVLGSRFTMHARRHKLRDLRQVSGAKEGRLFSMMQRLLHEGNIELPQELQNALDDASATRDQLGLMEAEYDEAEARYNSNEWRYSHKERLFVEKLADLRSHLARLRYNGAIGVNGDISRLPSSTSINTLGSTLTDRIGPIYSSEVPGTLYSSAPQHRSPDRSLAYGIPSQTTIPSIANPSKAWTDSNLNHSRVSWTAKVNFIDDWLFSIFSHSRFQQALHRAELDTIDFNKDLDNLQLQNEIKQNWHVKVGEQPEFHTGDSTLSQTNTGRRDPTSLIAVSDAGNSEIRVDLTTPLLRSDEVIDENEETILPATRGHALEDDNAREQTSRHMASYNTEEETDKSIDTEHSSRRNSQSSSHATYATEYTQTDMGLHITECVTQERDGSTTRNSSNQSQDSNPNTPTQPPLEEDSSTLEGHEAQAFDFSLSPIRQTTLILDQVIRKTRVSVLFDITPSNSSPSGTSKEDYTLSASDQVATNSTEPSINTLPCEISSSAKEETNLGLCPVAPHLSIPGAKFLFQFPSLFLQLTSLPACSCSHAKHQLAADNLPFVSHSDVSSELPGPGLDDLGL